jgi:hypothetical protein
MGYYNNHLSNSPYHSMKKQLAKIIRFRSQKVGGIRFIRVGKFRFSFCVSSSKANKKTLRKARKQLLLDI